MLLPKFLSRKISPEKSLDFLSQKLVLRPASGTIDKPHVFSIIQWQHTSDLCSASCILCQTRSPCRACVESLTDTDRHVLVFCLPWDCHTFESLRPGSFSFYTIIVYWGLTDSTSKSVHDMTTCVYTSFRSYHSRIVNSVPGKKSLKVRIIFFVTPAQKNREEFWNRTLIACRRMYFRVFLGAFLSPFILTKTRCFVVHQLHLLRHVGTYIFRYIFTSIHLPLWYQHFD